MIKQAICVLALSLCVGKSSAQEHASIPIPFVLGDVRSLYSKTLQENRTVNVYLPDGYTTDTQTHYPVIYLLDGSADEDFIHIVGLVQFCTMIGAMPKTIVVGIGNVNRKRDFTYPSTLPADKKLIPASGGSAAFIKFVKLDLKSFINKESLLSGKKGKPFYGLP